MEIFPILRGSLTWLLLLSLGAEAHGALEIRNINGSPVLQWSDPAGNLKLEESVNLEIGVWREVLVPSRPESGGYVYEVSSGDLTRYFRLTSPCSDQNTAPTVQILEPTPGTVRRRAVLVSIEASTQDSDGSIQKVEFFNAADKIGEASASPFRIEWQGSDSGLAFLTARVTDNCGVTATSDVVTIYISQAKAEPECVKFLLSRYLYLSTAEISLVSNQAVVWRDSCLDCGRGEVCLPALETGSRMVFQSQFGVHVVHLGEDGRAVLCAQGRSVALGACP